MQTCLNILLLCCAVMAEGDYEERDVWDGGEERDVWDGGEERDVWDGGEEKQVGDKLDHILQQITKDGSQRPPILGVQLMELRNYIETPDRKYTVIALFSPPPVEWDTSLYPFVFSEFYTTATSHALAPPDPSAEKIYFLLVDVGDYAEKPEESLPPDVITGPAIVMFKRGRGAFEPEYLEYARTGVEAEYIARWVYTNTDVRIKIVRSPKYWQLLYLAGVSVIVARVLAGLGLRWETLVARRTLASAAAGFCCLMTAGDMWNRIRRAAFFVDLKNRKNQLVVETYIVAIMYGAVVTGMILIIEARGGSPRVRRISKLRLHCGLFSSPDADKRLLYGLGLVCVFVSAIVSFFRRRVEDYPFFFLFP